MRHRANQSEIFLGGVTTEVPCVILDERCAGQAAFLEQPSQSVHTAKEHYFQLTMEMTWEHSGAVSSKSTTHYGSTNSPKWGWAEWEMAVDLDTIQSHMPDASNT